MLLFAVLAEFDGTGVPISYLFVEKDTSIESALPCTMTQALDQFLRPFLQARLYHNFIGRIKTDLRSTQYNKFGSRLKFNSVFGT